MNVQNAFRRAFRFMTLAAAMVALPCFAMDFTLIGSTLILSSGVVDNDLARVKDSLDPSRVKLIVLHNNKGGDLWNALRIGERIRESGVDTTISGLCQSACGLIFLGGVKRTYSDAQPIRTTFVGLHGAHSRKTKEAMTQLGPQISYFIETMTNGKYPKELMERTVYTKNPEDFIFAQHPTRFPGQSRGMQECLKQPDGKFKCALIEGLDALTVGVITSPEITILDEEVKERLKSLM